MGFNTGDIPASRISIMIAGFTGHQIIQHPERWGWVRAQFEGVLRERAGPVARVLTSLAAGGDQVFTEVALAVGVEIGVIVPCAGYAAAFTEPDALMRYQDLLARAGQVVELDYPAPSEEAFLMAGKKVVDLAELVVALWNGKEAAGRGGTGDIVAYARGLNRPLIHVNPDTMQVIGPIPTWRPDEA